jgi:hypothetical protein
MRRVLQIGAVLVFAAMLPGTAEASFPGQNGPLLLTRSGSECLWTVNPDGTGLAATGLCLSGYGYPPQFARFSPDGTHVVYDDGCVQGVFTAKLDGSDKAVRESNYICPTGDAWSPDGTRLLISTYFQDSFETDSRLFTISSSGGDYRFLFSNACPVSPPNPKCYETGAPDWSPDGVTILYDRPSSAGGREIRSTTTSGGEGTSLTAGQQPSHSPDGRRIAFARWDAGFTQKDIYVMNADGSGQVNLTNSPADDSRPIWSPDGKKIAFTSTPDGNAANNAVWTMNVDGSGAVQVAGGSLADWQPIPYPGYPRPRGATPVQIALVPAYAQCTTANRTHGAPLAYGSCAPPAQTSGTLTVGTPDANGQGAKLYSKILYGVGSGDVGIIATITDVRNKSDLSDYTGELSLSPGLRITDRSNTGPGPGTVTDATLPVTIPCAATSDTTIGSSCNLSTTVNAAYPGALVTGKRAIWQLGQVRVYDGGPDGQAATTADNTLFLDQGVFVP